MRVGTPRDVGDLIREERRTQGLRQEELALAAGTGRRFISEVERGKSTAQLGNALRVLAALGLKVEILRPEKQEVIDEGT